MENRYSIKGFKITEEARNDLPEFVLQKVHEFYSKLQNKNIPWKVVEDLKGLIKKFPKVPQFKNYLGVAYEKLKKDEFKVNLLKKTVEQHPNYIYGKLSWINYNLSLDPPAIEEAEKALNNADNINEAFPSIEVFHMDEVCQFYYQKLRIELMKGNKEASKALKKLLIDDLDYDEEEIEHLFFLREIANMANTNFEEFDKNNIEPVCLKDLDEVQDSVKPGLKNPVLYNLYSNEDMLPPHVIEEILSLDKMSLIQDFKTILKDTEKRYFYFEEEENADYLAIHTLALISKLEFAELLEDVFEFLRNDEDFLDFWLSDYMTEVLWSWIYNLSKNQLERLGEFLKEPGIYAYIKIAVFDALIQNSFDSQEDTQKVELILEDCLKFYTTVSKDKNVISTEYFSLLVCSLIDFNGQLYTPYIKKLYDLDYIKYSICGSYEDLMEGAGKHSIKKKSNLISSIYNFK